MRFERMPCTTPGTPRPIAAPHAGVVDESGEDAHRVRTAADAGNDHVGECPGHVEHLRPSFVTDERLELAHEIRVRVRADDRTETEVGVGDVGDPVAHRLVDGVLERPAARLDRVHLGTEQAHAEHVQFLTSDIDGAHVHRALEAHQRRRGGARHAVLAGARVGDDASLAHPLGEQRLADHVVDLVRARVVEVLTLEDQPQAQLAAEVVALGEDRGAPRVLGVHTRQFGAERRVVPCLVERGLELLTRRHQRLGHEAAAELAEAARHIRAGAQRRRDR
jgi:hypothetical protein